MINYTKVETMVGDPILMKVLRIQMIPRLMCILTIIVSHKLHQITDMVV